MLQSSLLFTMFNVKKIFPEILPKKGISISTVGEYNVGDIVKVCSDENKVREFQNCKKCGGYSAQRMQNILGKSVKVKHITQYCVKVECDENEFDLHPNLIEIIGQKQAPKTISNEIIDDNEDDFFNAVEHGNIEVFDAKLTLNILNMKYILGRTPINIACVNGRRELVESLIDFDADLDIADDNGNRPIQNATLNNYPDIITLIIKKDKDQIHTLDNDGRTLLHITIIQNNFDLTNYFLEHGINTNVKDVFGKTAFQYVIATTNPSLKELVLKFNTINSSCSINPSELFISSINDYDDQLYSSFKLDQNYYQRYMEITLMDPPKDKSVYETIAPPSVDTHELNLSSKETMDVNQKSNLTKQNECEICYSRTKTIAFVSCGHTSCEVCAKKLFQCHICQKEISDKLKIYT